MCQWPSLLLPASLEVMNKMVYMNVEVCISYSQELLVPINPLLSIMEKILSLFHNHNVLF